jgi:hypothetical protein
MSDLGRFFHENVGMTAWGLALHEESRLIAVSSNRREVTVFVPAVTFWDDNSPEQMPTTSFPEVTQPASYRNSTGTSFLIFIFPDYISRLLQVSAALIVAEF